jgi:FkbM family methyltransferase
MYHSEHGQDKWLNENIFREKLNGVFFEVGAIDGLIGSNTLFFERILGWNGLLVEASPEQYPALVANRPRVKTEKCAIYDRDGETIEFTACAGHLTGWSGIKKELEPQHLERMEINIPASLRSSVMVPTMTLASVLKKHGLQRLDYCCLDIEGAEFAVLKVFPFAEFDIEIFDIEDNFGNYPIEKLMIENGYRKIVRLGVSDIYQKVGKE